LFATRQCQYSGRREASFGYQTPQSVHMARNCGAQTLSLTMHYGGKNWGKIGEGMVGC